MKKTKMLRRRILSWVLCGIMLLQLLPLSAAARGTEWIAEFANSTAARLWAEAAGGTYLGGPFALLRASKTELEGYPIVSLTENSTVEGSSVSQPSDEKASEQYILTHKSWYAQDAWAALETFLASRTTPLTPADCATVRVAVIDSGIDATHEDLSGRVTAGWDAVNHTAIGEGVNSDVSADSHGTKVAGLIGAASDNGIGMVGAAWTFPVELIPVRVLGSANKGTVADVVSAIYWAVDEGNADILNLSFGQTARSVPTALQTAVLHAVEEGVIVVAAAGNDGEFYKDDDYSYYPAVLDGVLPVGSTGRVLGSSYGNYNNYVQRADFSNYPSYESECGKTFFYTPGEELLTTSAGNSYEEFSGTSASAALLSGMLAALKSCADATGQPSAENYLSYNKYSYLGGLYYQEYKYMAEALAAGYTSGDVRFQFDAHLPGTLRGTVTLSGILNDPACRYLSVSLFIDGTLVGTVARTEAAKQYLSFTVDTTAFADGYYYSDQIALMGTLADGTEEEIEHSRGFDIDNGSERCIVTVTSGGAPLVGAKGWIFRPGGTGAYWTDGLGQIDLPLSDTAGESALLVVGEELVVWRKLAPYPAGNRYAFGNDPALLTIRCSGETLAAAEGAVIYAAMPDGGQYEVGTVNGGETTLWVDADSPITFTVGGAGAILSETIDLSGEDVVWDLDSAETARITLTHDANAPTEGNQGTVRFLGLQLGGFAEQLLEPDGGSVLVTPGAYSVTGYVYWCDGDYYSTYAKVELGEQDVTGEGLTLTLGSGAPVATVSVGAETVTEGQSVTATLSFADSSGNAIAELGSSDAECSYREKYRYINLSIEEYNADTESWSEINQISLQQVPGSATVNGGQLGTQTGRRRIVFHGEYFISGMTVADATAEFELVPQETRPAATVRITMADPNGYNIYDVSAAAVLTDAEGNTIVREAYVAGYGEESVIKLPVGGSYTLAVLAVNYSEAYLTTCAVDLTEAAEGDEIPVALAADEGWIAHEIPWSGEPFVVRNLACAPFDDVPAYTLTGAGSNEHIGTLYADGFAEENLYFDVMPDDYEAECYEYPPVFTMKKTVDLSVASVQTVGLPKTMTLTAETEGDSAVLTPVITDAYGNEMAEAAYVARYGGMEGGDVVEGDMPAQKPTMVYPKVTVYNGDAEKIFEKNTAFLPVTLEGLDEGTYGATIVWKSSDIDLTGEQVNFTIGAGGGEPPVILVPQAPTAFRAVAAEGAVNLSWTAPAKGCAGFLLLRDGEVLAELSGEAVSYTDRDVVAGGYYMYTLYALDEDGRRSEAVTAGAAISAGADTQAPVWGSGAALTAEIGDGGVEMSWSRAQDSGSGVTSYLLLCNGEEIAQLFTRRYTHSNLQPGTDYVFSVKAVDGAGNVSEALTAEAVRVSRGILGVSLEYGRNRLGYMTGTALSIQVKTTADLESPVVAVSYTRSDGSTGVLTPNVAGADGSFGANLTLPDDFAQLDQITVTCGGQTYTCLTAPVVRCSAHVEVTVALEEAKTLYPAAVLTLYAASVGYAYSWPISDMAGSVEADVIADEDYQLTLADSSGNVLLTRKADLSADARITLGAEDARFLQLTVEGGYEGLAVSVTFDGRTVSGKLDESGTVIWSSGGRFLSVGSSGTLLIPELAYSQELTFDRVVNQMTVQPEALGYEVVTIPVTVLDTDGRGISGVEVRIKGSDVTETKTTGADGICVFTFANRKDHTLYLSMQRQRDDQGRCWASCSIAAMGDTAVLQPAPMYDRIRIRPVLDMDVEPENVRFTVNEKAVFLKDGVLCVQKDGWWNMGDQVRVTAEYTAGSVTYTGSAEYKLSAQTQTVELNLKHDVEVTVSLTDNGDPMKGYERYFAVYNADKERVTSFSTYQTSSTVTLVDGEEYTVLAGWRTVPWRYDPSHPAQATVVAAEGCQVTLDMVAAPDYALPQRFVSENGFRTAPSVSMLASGDVRVSLNVTSYPLGDTQIVYAYHLLTLPEGAQDISCSLQYTFDEETGLVTLSENLAQKYIYSQGRISFTIPAEKVPSEFLLQSLTRYRYGGKEYLRVNNEFELADYLMQVDVPGRISASALEREGLPLNIRVPLANGKVEVYANDTLLAAGAAELHSTVVVHPENRLGECALRVVYTTENGFALTREVTCEITADARPELQSANVRMGSKDLGDLMNPSGQLYYTAGSIGTLTCRAAFSNPELVERVWLCGKTESEFDRFELVWSDEENAFLGEGQIGTLLSPFTALWIEFDEKSRSIEETGNDVRGAYTVDRELTYTPKENPDNKYSYAPDPDLGEAVQAQALSDWEKYVELVNGGLYEMEEADSVEALNELFGADGVWDLPATTDGENHFSMRYGYDPDKVAEKLSTAEAFTVTINGEKRKVLIEFEEEDGDLYICYYGMGDLLIPAVPETGEPMMTASGSLIAGLKDFVKRHWEDGMEIKQKYDDYGWIAEGVWEELNKDPEGEGGEGGEGGSGDPCGGSGTGTGKQTREERRQQVDEMFDNGWEAAKAVSEGISMTGGFYGLESSMLGEFITQDGGAAHALFELQKQRIHELDDILDEIDEDAFPDTPADPCDPDEPDDPQKDDKDKDHPKLGYQPVYPLVDPSGYLYQGAPGYPVEGVKAYLYYLEADGEVWTLWNSEDFGQGPNPYPSDASGYYGWDVLPGKWKVVFEGEGYARAESIVLDVPPPHLDVDIAMTSTRNPRLLEASVKADGSVYLKFDHPMTTQSVLNNAVTVTLGSEVLTGTLTAVDPAVTAPGIKQAALSTDARTGLEVAGVFRFVPDDAILAGMTLEVTVDESVLGYNGLPMLSGWSDRLTVPERDDALKLQALERTRANEIDLKSGESDTLNGDDWYALFGDGFGSQEKRTDIAIRWRSNNESVAIVDETGRITAVGGGIASIIGEFEGRTIVFGVSVTRAPILADGAENDVKFCRDLNLVLGKACYMWSAAANFRLEDPMEGDEKYMPAAWRIKEAGVVTAEGTVSDSETSIKIIYTPTVLGTLTGEIDYQKYVYTAGRWVASGSPETAVRNITVTEVTGLTLSAPPKTAKPGEVLDLSAMRIGIALSDGSVSTVGYEKLASYGIAMNLEHGDTLGGQDTVLVLTHARTGITLMIELQSGDGDRVHVCGEHLTPVAERGAGCTEDGCKAHYRCSCGRYFEDAAAAAEIPDIAAWKNGAGRLPALGHIEVIDASTEPTCTASGLTAGAHCERCGEVLTARETIPALGHDDKTVNGVRACAVCGEKFNGFHDGYLFRDGRLWTGIYGERYYLNGVLQLAYQLVEHDGIIYFISDAHNIAKNCRLYLSERFVTGKTFPDGRAIKPGYYEFDENGAMVIPEEKEGVVGDYLYINDVKQVRYRLIGYRGNYYFINDGDKVAKDCTLYLSAYYLQGTDFAPGYYYFDSQGRMEVKWGVHGDYLYLNGSKQLAYQVVEFEGDRYFISDGHKIAKNCTLYLSAAYVDAPGYYSFDGYGVMSALNGVVGDYLYLNGVKQTAYQLVAWDGAYYFINDGHRIARSCRLYLSAQFLTGTAYEGKPGWYRFDADGKLIPG